MCDLRLHRSGLALALLAAPSVSYGDRGRPPPDPTALLTQAASRADLGELVDAARRIPAASLASCVQNAERARRLACIEVARFSPPSPPLLTALAIALAARDRAVATAAGAALGSGLAPERLAEHEVTSEELVPVVTALLAAAGDRRLGPDVRAAALHAMRDLSPVRASALTGALDDPDPRVRREALAILALRGSAPGALARVAERDPDDQVAALAAAFLCESGSVSRAADARVRRMLADGMLGPATLGPLLNCARARADPQSRGWLAGARSSPRQDVRALAGAR